ncbi:hypothetical protein [Burkholderia multivorans]|uniref:hypothetical protein n=1 Tax=Burkholderia multivorans TaxID=87883 RepID=UPI001C22DF58|nr:hypothetical protein [Burkholderia multivorans]MBU9208923.1 hypothetical protein [Burkholderia multivorans]UQN70570.1 hypothetical protein L0Z45_06770 [Burkholderia multivorans]UQN76302.1 hypothetical protein L0Z11_06750 [Burkholderia multivorans]
MNALIRKIRKVLSDGVFVGVVIPIALAIVPSYLKKEVQPAAGVVELERGFTYSLFDEPTLLAGANSLKFGLTLNNQPVPLGHLQVRPYTLRNLSGRNLSKADFESPITIKAAVGQKILYVGVNPALGHAPVKVTLVSDTEAVIDPMLLNINEQAVINILLYRESGTSSVESPFADDSGVLNWTADIKGANLSVVGVHRPEMPPANPTKWILLYTMHMGYGVLALVIVGFLLSGLQIKKFNSTVRSLDFKGIMLLAGRVTLAWIAADTIVRMFDYQVMPIFGRWDNWTIIGVYVVSMLFPLPSNLFEESVAGERECGGSH